MGEVGSMLPVGFYVLDASLLCALSSIEVIKR